MLHKKTLWVSAFFFWLLHFSQAADLRKAAIFVENRAGKQFNDKVAMLEDLVGTQMTAKGFSVISREVAINAIKNYSTTDKDAAADVSKLDALLSENSSALRLGQNMGADYLILVSLLSYGQEKKTFTDKNISTVNEIHTLRASYKIAEATAGGSLAGDVFKVSKTQRQTENSQTENSDLINELLDEVAAKMAENVGTKKIAEASAKAELVEISVSCGMQDLAQVPMSIPDARLNADGTLVLGKDKLPMEVVAPVELNGTIIGSAPGTFKVPPGLSKIRITREGFRDWERTINPTAGLKLRVALQMSDEGYQRWTNNMTFLETLENGRKLTDAEVKRIEGIAQAWSQSGFKVDVKADIKGDAIAKPQVSVFKSLFKD